MLEELEVTITEEAYGRLCVMQEEWNLQADPKMEHPGRWLSMDAVIERLVAERWEGFGQEIEAHRKAARGS